MRFYLRGEDDYKHIQVSLNVSAGLKFRAGLPFKIHTAVWDKKAHLPKATMPQYKELTNKLLGLQLKIYNACLDTQSYTPAWFKGVISDFLKPEKELKELFSDFFKSVVDGYQSGVESGNISNRTFLAMCLALNCFLDFESDRNKQYLIKDVGEVVLLDFVGFLSNKKRYSQNSINKIIDLLKTVIRKAARLGKETGKGAEEVKVAKRKIEVHILTPDEIKKIADADMPNDSRRAVRDWLVIGCYTGQRQSDLLRMETGMIKTINGYDYIILTQQKTKKAVQIPIHKEVKKILSKRGGHFPPVPKAFTTTVKKVCRLAGIDTPTVGRLFHGRTKSRDAVTAPKYLFISSHTCRRSFATNFYGKIPTPLLMNITAHGTEQMFLAYIGKVGNTFSEDLAKLWAVAE